MAVKVREIEPTDQTTRSTMKLVAKHCEAWQRDQTHWSNNEIDGEAGDEAGRTTKHCEAWQRNRTL